MHKPRNEEVRPLHEAARHGHVDTAKLLLQLRADVDAQDNEGRTACWEAAFHGHDRVIRLLISVRASFIADGYGCTPVFVAAQQGHDRVIVTLARARASIDEGISKGGTPIAMAAYIEHEVVVRLLAHMGARLLMPNGSGFWLAYKNDDTRMRMKDFWRRIINAGGDEPTEESRRLRRRLLVQAKIHDPRDGGPDEEPLGCDLGDVD